ncbi:MAG: hypothetical protein WD066_09215 [Planctomycetaceae bacterium]
MRSWWIGALSALLVSAIANSAATPAFAVEPYQEFLNGLRARGYYDAALDYLAQIEREGKAPAEIRRGVPYERAMTILGGASSLTKNPDERAKLLDQASKHFEDFVRDNPDDPRSANADSQRASILLNKARVQVWQSQSPENEGRRAEFQAEARTQIEQARAIYQSAHDKFKAEFDKYPVYIPETEKERREARSAAELGHIVARLNLAQCTYEQAQTYPPGSPERNDLLKQAAQEFEKIGNAHRTMGAGLMADLWQGKCFEEMDEIGKALGIYNKLLDHDGADRPAVQSVQRQAQHFQLICLNHPQRNEFRLVINKATEWLKSNAVHARTRTSLGIRWERARAYEQLGLGRDLPEAEQKKNLEQALADAFVIRTVEGQHREPAIAMADRIDLLLKGEKSDPQDFETAFILANSLIRRIVELDKRRRAAADDDERAEVQSELEAELADAGALFHLALGLVKEDTDPRQVNVVRTWLAHVELQSGRPLDAAVIAGFIARKYAATQSDTALDAARLTLAAFQQAYREAPEDDRDFELERMMHIGRFIVDTWPGSSHADAVRMELGKLYFDRGEPLEAARWYSEVPETAHHYPSSQCGAGRAYWRAWQMAMIAPAAERPSEDELKKWLEQAQEHLRTGLDRHEKTAPPTAAPEPEFVDARLILARIANFQGDYPRAIELLTDGPRSPVEAVRVDDGEPRPAQGLKSKAYAAEVHQQLLRSYVGDRRIDDALQAMDALERFGGRDNVGIYVMLGQELQKEIERLDRSDDKQRLSDVLASFDDFLAKLYDRQEGQTSASMHWIAETYFGLGEGLNNDPTAAAEYFDKAATTYQTILDRARQEGEAFIAASRLPGVRLRLVSCRRRQGKFQEALDLAKAVLSEKPNVLSAQFEAASVLEDWAASGEADNYLKAILGTHEDYGQTKVHIWGWGGTANNIKKLLDQRGFDAEPDPELEEQHLEARFKVSSVRRRYGLSKTGAARNKQLEMAMGEIVALSRIRGRMAPEWWNRFDTLYQQAQSDLGVAQPKALERPAPIVPRNTTPAENQPARAAAGNIEAEPAANAPADGDSTNENAGSGVAILIVALLLAAAAGVGVFCVMGGTKRRRRPAYGMSSSFGGTGRSAGKQPAATGAATAARGAASRRPGSGVTPRPPRPTSAK